jgi:hypothetical protein
MEDRNRIILFNLPFLKHFLATVRTIIIEAEVRNCGSAELQLQ